MLIVFIVYKPRERTTASELEYRTRGVIDQAFGGLVQEVRVAYPECIPEIVSGNGTDIVVGTTTSALLEEFRCRSNLMWNGLFDPREEGVGYSWLNVVELPGSFDSNLVFGLPALCFMGPDVTPVGGYRVFRQGYALDEVNNNQNRTLRLPNIRGKRIAVPASYIQLIKRKLICGSTAENRVDMRSFDAMVELVLFEEKVDMKRAKILGCDYIIDFVGMAKEYEKENIGIYDVLHLDCAVVVGNKCAREWWYEKKKREYEMLKMNK